MSAFLGPIHFWLYEKVRWHEALLDEIYAEMKTHGSCEEIDLLKENLEVKYGLPVVDELSTVIETDNIHGWLQAKIQSLEYRMAGAITKGLEKHWIEMTELENIYKLNGIKANEAYQGSLNTPSEIFKGIYDYLLEGMPCDRVNQPTASDDDSISWVKRICLHEVFWSSVGGDVAVYNHLRTIWLGGFVSEGFELEVIDSQSFTLSRRVA